MVTRIEHFDFKANSWNPLIDLQPGGSEIFTHSTSKDIKELIVVSCLKNNKKTVIERAPRHPVISKDEIRFVAYREELRQEVELFPGQYHILSIRTDESTGVDLLRFTHE